MPEYKRLRLDFYKKHGDEMYQKSKLEPEGSPENLRLIQEHLNYEMGAFYLKDSKS